MQKLVIIAYMGTGKTWLADKYDSIVDFDHQDYRYIYDESIKNLPLEQRKGNDKLRTLNPLYPKNFINEALKLLNEGKILVSPFIDHVYEAYKSTEFQSSALDVKVVLVCPRRIDFEEYRHRFAKRGNSPEFISKREREFSDLVDIFENEQKFDKILISKGQFLEDVLKEEKII